MMETRREVQTAFSTNEGHSSFFGPVDIPTSLLLESKGRRSSMTV